MEIVDGVYNDFSNEAGFRAECEQGRDLGMDGKTLIHPNQVAICNEVFAPAEAEIAFARKIIDVFDLPENSIKGALQIDGKMVERLPRRDGAAHRRHRRSDRQRLRGTPGQLPVSSAGWRRL